MAIFGIYAVDFSCEIFPEAKLGLIVNESPVFLQAETRGLTPLSK